MKLAHALAAAASPLSQYLSFSTGAYSLLSRIYTQVCIHSLSVFTGFVGAIAFIVDGPASAAGA